MADGEQKLGSKDFGDIDVIISRLFSDECSVVKREKSNLQACSDSALVNLIDYKIQTKSLPLALRKRLMYQRAVGG